MIQSRIQMIQSRIQSMIQSWDSMIQFYKGFKEINLFFRNKLLPSKDDHHNARALQFNYSTN